MIGSNSAEEKDCAYQPAPADNVVYQASVNLKHIEQYYSIREEAYNSLIGDEYYAGPDEHDEDSCKFLGVIGDDCIGGIRITVSSPSKPRILPLENKDYRLRELYKSIDFDNLTYCEASRLAMSPNYRRGHYLTNLFTESTRYSIHTLGIELVFGRSPDVQTRKFQIHYKNMGFDLVVRKDLNVVVKNLENLNINLWAIDFTPDRRYVSVLKEINR